MNKTKLYSVLAALFIALSLSSCHKDDTDVAPDVEQPTTDNITTLNIDVIIPFDIRNSWQPSIDWALSNIEIAQTNLANKIKLNLRYHDEDKEDLDRLAYDLTHPEEGDDTCHAIIGPYHSSNANTILRYAGRNRLPVVMPTCTSAELQRTNARNTYPWFLTESDVTQCEMMVVMAYNTAHKNIVLLYSDDAYGQSFKDWIGYYAVEHQCTVEGILKYDKNTDVIPFFNSVYEQGDGSQSLFICYALSDASLYKDALDKVNNALGSLPDEATTLLKSSCILTDVAYCDQVINDEDLYYSYGIAPTSSPVYGFPQKYEARNGAVTLGGYAQIYDALTIIALGAAHQQVNGDKCLVAGKQVTYTEAPFAPGLTDHMRSVVASENGAMAGWDANGLTLAFSEIAAGHDVTVVGATGTLNFDDETHTKILNTSYLIWTRKFDYDAKIGSVSPLVYLSTEGSSTQASSTSLWQLDKRWNQNIDDIQVSHSLPPLSDRWAVVISPSTTWANYRHQADAFAMYQTLRNQGYDDDHIVLIVEDNLADDSRNIYPGEIFVERDDDTDTHDRLVNENVRENAMVDYRFSDLTPDDIADIMLGRKSDRLPHVITPTSSSDVIFFWSGHGGNTEGPLWGNEDATQYFGQQRIRDIVEQMNDNDMYRRMFFAIETCYSGKWGEALEGIPDVLILTAATPLETSKADIYNTKLGVYLSNAFARTFRRQIIQKPDITIYDLYRELFKTTKGSHVSICNQHNYGSVYSETMGEFLK